jgi:hypothetical protein
MERRLPAPAAWKKVIVCILSAGPSESGAFTSSEQDKPGP